MQPIAGPSPLEMQQATLRLLRGESPGADAAAESIDAALRRYECGGYLHDVWSLSGGLSRLPPGWAAGLARARRKTALDNLVALADFRVFGRILERERIPFILLKGSAYLHELYDDPGQRMLTDIDLLIRPADVRRLWSRLAEAGYLRVKYDDEYRRFEVAVPGAGRCSFEVHWRLGLLERTIDQDGIWARSAAADLEGVRHHRLAPRDAVLYHVSHQAEHFFGPSIKWAIDLRLMLRRWPLDPASLVEQAEAWRVRTALSLAILYLEKLFPGEPGAGLRETLTLGGLRQWMLGPFLDRGPLGFMRVGEGRLARYGVRCLLLDRPSDLLPGMARVLRRGLSRARDQASATARAD